MTVTLPPSPGETKSTEEGSASQGLWFDPAGQAARPAQPSAPGQPDPAPQRKAPQFRVSGADLRRIGKDFVRYARSIPGWRLIAGLTVSGLCVWFVLYASVFSGLQEARAQHNLYADFREALTGLSPDPNKIAPLGGAITPGTPVAMIDAPKAGISRLVVVEGTSSSDLRSGPGHLRNTPLPGQVGTSLLLGRSSMFGGPFGDLAALRRGDKIKITTGQGVFTFNVRDVRRPGDPVPATLPSDTGQLILATSEGSGLLGAIAPGHVLYVDAALSGQVQPAPPGRPASVPKDELLMKSDTGQLMALVLWLQLLVLALGGSIWAWARWGRAQAWMLGLPVVVAALWGASGAAIVLLPNLT